MAKVASRMRGTYSAAITPMEVMRDWVAKIPASRAWSIEVEYWETKSTIFLAMKELVNRNSEEGVEGNRQNLAEFASICLQRLMVEESSPQAFEAQ